MCAQFELAVNLSEVVRSLEAAARRLTEESGDSSGRWLDRVKNIEMKDVERKPRTLPYYQAPALRLLDEKLRLEPMQFSLVPAWSKEKRVKFATHNARIESVDERTGKPVWIHEKPTWRMPFQKRHCVVPMTGFFEAVYEGPFGGNMVQFCPSAAGDVLLAGGIWEEWRSPASGEVIESFTILTDEPIDFVKANGHDRSPVFLRPEAALRWLEFYPPRAEDAIAFLRSSVAMPELSVEIDRPLKSAQKKK